MSLHIKATNESIICMYLHVMCYENMKMPLMCYYPYTYDKTT